MTHSPQSPLTTFAAAIAATSAIRSAGVRVFLGRQELVRTTAPRRIVFVPVAGTYKQPTQQRGINVAEYVLATVEQGMGARIWAQSIDDAWDIQQRLIQALNVYTSEGGYRFLLDGPTWDTDADTGEQGEALTLAFRLILPVERPAESSVVIDTVIESTLIVNPATEDEEAGPTVTIT